MAYHACWIPEPTETEERSPEPTTGTFVSLASDFAHGAGYKDAALSLDAQMAALNPSQRHAVEAPFAHVLVFAGAGTGKTRVLSLRYLHLMHHGHIDPSQIMAVTFTNKAAQELKRRLAPYVPVHNLWIGTFHALGLRLLRCHGEYVGRGPGFAVLDPGDQGALMQKVMKAQDAQKILAPKAVLHTISQWKHEGITPAMAAQDKRRGLMAALYQAYETHMQRMNAMDFDDLLLGSLHVLTHCPQAQETCPMRHLLVDEYQDINGMQNKWLRAFPKAHLFCVGDDDQSIYGWRGARVENMLHFSHLFPDAHVVCLEDNYRSTSHILEAAGSLIACNRQRYGKMLRTQNMCGEKVYVQGLWDSKQEATFVADSILQYYDAKEPLHTMAILIRTSAQSRELEEQLTLQNIPYHLVGGTRFYDRLEIRDMVAYLHVIHQNHHHLAFERILNTPRRGIGASTLEAMYALMEQQKCTLEQAARMFCASLNPQTLMAKTLGHFLSLLDAWRTQAATLTVSQLAQKIFEESGYKAFWQGEGLQGHVRLENVEEFIASTEAFTSLQQCLDHVGLLSDSTEEEERASVVIMTVHAAKGLEFDTVFLPGWEEKLFPHVRAMEEAGQKGVEEERRLAYVALTRARKRAIISFCWNRKYHSGFGPASPSRFIQELPQEHVTLCLRRHGKPLVGSAVPGIPPMGQGASVGSGPSSVSAPEGAYFAPTNSVEALRQGCVVYHKLFGKGTVQRKAHDVVCVHFETCGEKNILSRFLHTHPL